MRFTSDPLGTPEPPTLMESCGVVLLHAAICGIVRHPRERTTAAWSRITRKSRVQLCSVLPAFGNRNERQEKGGTSRNPKLLH